MAYHINITTVSRVALGQGHGVAILQWLEVSVPTHRDKRCFKSRGNIEHQPYGCFLKWWYHQIIHFNRVFHYKPSILEVPPFKETSIYHHVYHIFQHVYKHAHSNKIQEPSHLHQPSTISTYTNHLNWRPPSGYRQSRGMNGSKRQLELVCVQVFRIVMVKTAESISNLTS